MRWATCIRGMRIRVIDVLELQAAGLTLQRDFTLLRDFGRVELCSHENNLRFQAG